MLQSGAGAHFAVWAPNAAAVSVIGDWNGWKSGVDALAARGDSSGIWEGEVSAVRRGQAYKYRITSRVNGFRVEKADPYGVLLRGAAGHRVARVDAGIRLAGRAWMAARGRRNGLDAPMSIYELHPARGAARTAIFSTTANWRIALADYANETGFHARRTHADHRASLLRIMGISDHGLFCADRPLRRRRRT